MACRSGDTACRSGCTRGLTILATYLMQKPKSIFTDSSRNADEIEASFYEALQIGDVEKLMDCWADEDNIVCIHPGGARVVGAARIRGTFEIMFANGTIRAFAEKVRKIETAGASVHSVLQRI